MHNARYAVGLVILLFPVPAGCASAPPRGSAGDDDRADASETPAATRFGVAGGTLGQLLFAVVGDTRPPSWDDVSGYPTAQITKIYQGIVALRPQPAFVIGTGDYQFSSTGSGSTAPQQLAIYARAREVFPGPFFAAMGNHECTGGTTSNCVPGQSGTTANLQAFTSTFLVPLQKTKPYYAIPISAADGSWTAKVVVTAANAWDDAQASWLASTLAQPTRYTFLVRHEPHDTNPGPPGVGASEALLAQFPYTLSIVGHAHTYGHYAAAPKEVLFGNGGAPLDSPSSDYGFGLFAQRNDGAIVVDAIDWRTGQADPSFHFVVKPDGMPTD